MQVLDPRLYPQGSPPLSKQEKSPPKKKDEDNFDEDFEDLAPLTASRSYSMPMPAAKQGKQQITTTTTVSEQPHYEKLDSDQQFVVLFNTCVWIC